MLPLKVIAVGLRWELSIDLTVVLLLLVLIWVCLHRLRIPTSWKATMGYAALVTLLCEAVHFFTSDPNIDSADLVDTVHLEVLLPAFAIGCIAVSAHAPTAHAATHPHMDVSAHGASPAHGGERHPPDPRAPRPPSLGRRKSLVGRTASGTLWRTSSDIGPKVDAAVSAVFMVLVGLSMPRLFGAADAGGGHRRLSDGLEDVLNATGHSGSGSGSGSGSAVDLEPGMLIAHVVAVSALMVLGKMFPTFCYKDEATLKTRLALSLGMCPRGEVGAGVIVISLSFGIEGPAITIAVLCLAINLVLSSAFILAVRTLAKDDMAHVQMHSVPGAGRAGTPSPTFHHDHHDHHPPRPTPSPDPHAAGHHDSHGQEHAAHGPTLATAPSRV